MSFTPRARRLMTVWALLCVVVVAGLSVLVAFGLTRLDRFDTGVGASVYTWSVTQPWLLEVLLLVEAAFGTIALTAYTLLAAALFTFRKHPRAAIWTIVVMTAAGLSTSVLKELFDRGRPVWEDPVHALDSFSFPSGHATGIAAAGGIAILLASMLVRRRSQRRTCTVVALAFVALVGADRLLLGVHNISDVIAGYAVGTFWVLAGALAYDPAPRSQPRPTPDSPRSSTRKLAVVLNPIKIEDIGIFKVLLERMAREAGWGAPAWHETTLEDPGRSMAGQAVVDGADLVLVVGGDGTVRTVCAELAGTGIPVGVVPAGTGNLLARNLGIPLYLQGAIDVALHGQDRSIDLVAISGDGIGDGIGKDHFLVMAGMGFDAAIMEGANDQIKARVGWLAYVVSGLTNMMFPAVRLEISMDDGPWTRHRARTVVIGNVGYLQAGMPLLPDAAIDDGILDVVILHPRWFLSWVPLVVRVLSKGKRTDDTINRMTGRKVSIRTNVATPRQLDGDFIGLGKELHAEVEHGRLVIRVPR